MRTIIRSTYALLVATLIVSMAASQARAWSPPDGPADQPDQTTPPPTPTTLLPQAHGYIIQNGISILNNDGYWFAAQMLRQWQQELLNGVRYADVYLGRQKAVLELCFTLFCKDVYSTSWPLAGDTHYFNPDTGQGLDLGAWNELAFWADVLPQWVLTALTGGLASFDIDTQPDVEDSYPSALEVFDENYGYALDAYFNPSLPGIGGRQGTALAMFYLGWASHLMQDLTVVHHTFDSFFEHHNEYENAANGFVTSPPIADGQQRGIYANQLPVLDCDAGARTCFASYAAHESHDATVWDAVTQGDYSNVQFAIPFAQSLQAGLYAAFLTDIGLRPVHMSAVMAAL